MKFHVVAFHGFSSSEAAVMKELGFEEANGLEDADVVIFPGGADIHPALYGEDELPATSAMPKRDDYEVSIFEMLRQDQWKIGICRGAQLLCALNGGNLWQDVDRHAGTYHVTTIVDNDIAKKWGKDIFVCNSVHHQSVRDLPLVQGHRCCQPRRTQGVCLNCRVQRWVGQ